jgi:SAM-dependent methyltransferase
LPEHGRRLSDVPAEHLMDADAWDARYAASELLWSVAPNQFVAAELAGLEPGRALDLAAGEGRNALWLAERGWRVTAVDFSQVGLDKARALQDARPGGRGLDVEWVCADVLEYDAGNGGYDVAVMAYLQVPAEQRRAAVRKAFDSLAEGGTLLVVAHDSSNLVEGTGGPQDPAVLFTADDVLSDLAGSAFRVLRAERVERLVRSDDEHRGEAPRTAYDALVRLRRTDGPAPGRD